MQHEADDRIWDNVRLVPAGKVATYSQIAELSGIPGEAKIVGKSLHFAPKELNLPWHRVLRTDGSIAFPDDSRAAKEQSRRLQEEGVMVINNRVHIEVCLWHPDGSAPPQFQLDF